MRALLISIGLCFAVTLGLAGCTGPVRGMPVERSVPESDRAEGQRLIAAYGCGACHTIDGVPGANAAVGPPLVDFSARTYIAGQLPNTSQNLILWLRNPQLVEPNTAMPNLGVSEEEARHMAAYLYNQTDRSLWFWLQDSD